MDLMPPKQNADQAAETEQVSPVETDVSAQAPSAGATDPASPPVETESVAPSDADTDEPKSLEEAVSRALDGPPDAKSETETETDDGEDGAADPDPDAPPSENAKPDDAADPADADDSDDDDDDADPSEEELKALRPNVAKRLSALMRQRKAAKQEAASLRPSAEQYQAIRSYMSKNDLSDTEVAELFRVGADLKSGEPERLKAFLDRVTPMVQFAQEVLGQSVPADLQEQVDAGEMTDQAARELARHRRTAELSQTRLQREQERSQQAQQAQQAQAHQASVATALQGWTAQKAASDPDFARKQDAMKVIAQGLVAERGLPRTPEEAVRYAEDAYRLVGGVAAPARKPTRPSPSTSASPSRSGVNPAPTSLADIVQQGLNLTG